MKYSTTATLTTAAAAGFAAAVVGLAAPAVGAPTHSDNAIDTIRALEADGNRVIVNRQSAAALADASVISLRVGEPVRQYVWDAQRDRRILQTVGNFIFVDVK